MEFLGLPVEDWEFYAPTFHDLVAFSHGSDEFNAAIENYMAINDRLSGILDDRRNHPRDDHLTRIVQFEIDGQPLSQEDALNVVGLILAGGVDTTTNLMSHTFHYLDQNLADRERLIADPALFDSACEEFLRLASPGQVHVRTATRDVELGSQLVKAGERVLLSMASANRDEEVFDCPDQVDIERFPNHHVAFGMGPHRCVGAAFARQMFATLLGAVLARLPDYELLPGAERYAEFGIQQGWVSMPARFTPGSPVGAPLK
jgi:cytochrome P450